MHKCLDSNSEEFMSQHSKDIKALGDYFFNEELEESKMNEPNESVINPVEEEPSQINESIINPQNENEPSIIN